jgi:hypothetical protein
MRRNASPIVGNCEETVLGNEVFPGALPHWSAFVVGVKSVFRAVSGSSERRFCRVPGLGSLPP